jgi:hypothetical protein
VVEAVVINRVHTQAVLDKTVDQAVAAQVILQRRQVELASAVKVTQVELALICQAMTDQAAAVAPAVLD